MIFDLLRKLLLLSAMRNVDSKVPHKLYQFYGRALAGITLTIGTQLAACRLENGLLLTSPQPALPYSRKSG